MTLAMVDARIEWRRGGWIYTCPQHGPCWFSIPDDLFGFANQHRNCKAQKAVEDDVTAAPSLTADQRRAGHRAALELRKARMMVKLRIAAGELRICDAFGMPECEGMQVVDLLQSLPRVGERRAVALLELAGVPAGNTVRRCGWRQRDRLFEVLEKRGN